MLEPLMLATEPFGTWGPGPIPVQGGWWSRLFDSIVNDPRAVTTIFAAFFGFFTGVLIKYKLDRRAEQLRRESDKRILAAALRAELVSLDVECKSRIENFEAMLKRDPRKEVLGGPHSLARLMLPPRRIWMAHLGRIGELEGVDPETLTLVHATFDSFDLFIEALRQRSGDQGVSRNTLDGIIDRLRRMREGIGEVGGSLVKLTGARPTWWRRLLRS